MVNRLKMIPSGLWCRSNRPDDRSGIKRRHNVKNVIVADRIDERLEKAKRAGLTGRLITARHRLARFSLKRHQADINYRCGLSSFYPEKAVTLASPAARIVLMGFSSERLK